MTTLDPRASYRGQLTADAWSKAAVKSPAPSAATARTWWTQSSRSPTPRGRAHATIPSHVVRHSSSGRAQDVQRSRRHQVGGHEQAVEVSGILEQRGFRLRLADDLAGRPRAVLLTHD